jgi:hypothetical protein
MSQGFFGSAMARAMDIRELRRIPEAEQAN